MRRRAVTAHRRSKDTSAIDRINELSKIARTSWFGLLAYLAFAGVTLLGVEDADFFIDSRQTDLPLIGVKIPTRDFFVFGPVLGTALFVYLHLYLLKLWEALAAAKPRPGGEPLSVQVTPWLINDLGLALRRDGAFRRRPMDWLSHLVTFLLVFAIGPIVIGYFWLRYWPAHELGYSIFNALLFTLTTMTMLASLFTAVTRLRYGHSYLGGWWHLAALVPTVLILAPAMALTVAKTEGPERLGRFRAASEWVYEQSFRGLVALKLMAAPEEDPVRFVDGEPENPFPLKIAQADLREVAFVSLPDDWLAHDVHMRRFRLEWCARQGLDAETCGPPDAVDPEPPQLSAVRAAWCAAENRKLRDGCDDFFADLDRRFLPAWTEERAARIAGLNAWSPRNKDLRGAEMQGADLSGAQLQGADLSWAQMRGAVLVGAQMQGADLTFAGMQGADLSWAQLQGAVFGSALMEGANLFGAEMRGANLRAAWMRGADLRWADMQETVYSYMSEPHPAFGGLNTLSAKWTGGAPAHSTDFRGSFSLTQERLSALIGDGRTLLPDTGDPETGASLYIPSCWATEPGEWPLLVENFGRYGSTEDRVRELFLCPTGTVPQKTGTPWPVDQPPPWEKDPDWKPEDRGPVEPAVGSVE